MPRLLSDAENVVREEEIIDSSIEGPIDHAIAVLESFRARGNDVFVERETDYEGGYYLMVKWWRVLSEDEIAAQQASDESYRKEAERAERQAYERLKAKFEKG